MLDNPRINYPDGGVDTQVNKGGHRGPWDYFKGPTTWQYKAVELEELTDSKVRNEISGNSKGYVRSLLKDGYAYRLCVAHDGPAEKRNSIKASLDAEIKKVRLDAPESSVLFASDIVAWVNAFPAIAAEMLDSSMTEFFHFATWQNRERSRTKIFVDTPGSGSSSKMCAAISIGARNPPQRSLRCPGMQESVKPARCLKRSPRCRKSPI